MKNYFQEGKESIVGVVLWVVTFFVYLSTLAPTVEFIDSGELATVACTLGIPHPTGYPLFTLVGRIFTMLPIAQEPIVRLHIMSALFTSLAATAFYFLLLNLLGNAKTEIQRDHKIVSSAFATLALAFSQTFWGQGVSVEVYSLHLLLITCTTLFFIKAIHEDRASWWFLFAFILGLSFTNHLTTILLAPAFLFLFFVEHKNVKEAFRRIGALVLPFVLGLSVYLYLPVRALEFPLLNWGNPQTFEKFWWHFTGKQFRVWMFSSTDAAKEQFDYFLQSTPAEFYYIPLIFALVGFLSLMISDRRKFIFILLLLVSCVGYSINYDIHDIDSYFLLAFVALMSFAAFGIRWVLSIMNNIRITVLIIALSGLLALQIVNNWNEVDRSKNYIVEDYAKNILRNLPRNAIIISYQWDYFVSAAYYLQRVKNFRPDVVVLDKELFRRSWYIPQVEKMYPSVMNKSKNETELFLKELYKFEHDLPYDFTSIEGRYTDLLKSIVDKNSGEVSCFVTSEVEPNYTTGYNRIPYGFAYLLTKDSAYIQCPFPEIQFRNLNHNDKYIQQVKQFSATVLYQRSVYEKYYGKDSLSSLYHQKFLHFKVSNDSP
ncbi:MAG: DUF2723 domain-containing protein [Bacteroidota bacterium]|nr:DUF2723 domain-containing protein [Bacteroidota bacterium]